MKTKIDISQLAEITAALSHYDGLASYFGQLDHKQKETLQGLVDKALSFSKDKKYMDAQSYQYWQNCNLHVVNQTWGSTSCGWEGMGGAAMSESYTVVIENLWTKCIFVYYGGKLAYIAYIDEKLAKFSEAGYRNLPGMSGCRSTLNIAYKSR